jgi:hypothetical protein
MITGGSKKQDARASVTRRDFLGAGALGLGYVGFNRAGLLAAGNLAAMVDRSVILLLLVGGPSQLETWDPKPDAPAEVRGPFRSIETRCAGARICEHLPRLAARMDRIALIRSVHHDAAPIHETGHQLLQTGRLCQERDEAPHFGSIVAAVNGSRGELPASVILPGPIAGTGVPISHGQSSAWLGAPWDPFTLNADPGSPDFDAQSALKRATAYLDEAACAGRFIERSPGADATPLARGAEQVEPGRVSAGSPIRRTRGADATPLARIAQHGEPGRVSAGSSFAHARNAFDIRKEKTRTREAYGSSTFGQSCLLARRLVEAGVRVVTVNMFATVFNQVTWDCHGSAPFSSLNDYGRELLPSLDRAFSALIDDLHDRGRLDSTLVVAAGEFGRTPRINASGGRDHWPGVWSVALAGGGIRGGQVIGASDAGAGAPADRPVTPQDLLATIYHSLGIDSSEYLSGTGIQSAPIVEDGRPIRELFV